MSANRYVKNITKHPVSIPDISTYGITLHPQDIVDLLQHTTIDKIKKSSDLVFAVNSNIIKIFGPYKQELSTADGIFFLRTGILKQEIQEISGNNTPEPPPPSPSDPVSGSIIRNSDEQIEKIELTNGIQYNFIRDINGLISEINNQSYVWTFNRDSENRITSWTVT